MSPPPRSTLQTPAGPAERLSRRRLASGVQHLHIETDRFPGAWVRLALQGLLDEESTGVSLMGEVLGAACARYPTRRALGHRLVELYGASLDIGPEKFGEHQRLAFQLAWPLPRGRARRRTLQEGLQLVGEILHAPLRGPAGGLDAHHTAVERENLRRALAARADDRSREALDGALQVACRDEGYRWPARGRAEDLADWDGDALARLHAERMAAAPMDLLTVAPCSAAEMGALLAPLLAASGARKALPSPVDARPGAARVRVRHRQRDGSQSRVVLVWRTDLAIDDPLQDAGDLAAGMLGGSSASLGFRILREQEGLCYDIHAMWVRSKGLLILQAGTDPNRVPALRRGAQRIVQTFSRGTIDATARDDLLIEGRERLRSLADRPGARLRWAADAAWLSLAKTPRAQHERLARVDEEMLAAFCKSLRLDTCFVVGPGGTP